MSKKIGAHNVAMAGRVKKAWLELREEWGWANISDAEFIERAERIGMGRYARELVAEELQTKSPN
ncbi:MAG TPA: hypothetical protein VFP79_20000 [Pseudolabrys sp.]|nr:hypothetical protein [Pseudolabrys sp.]